MRLKSLLPLFFHEYFGETNLPSLWHTFFLWNSSLKNLQALFLNWRIGAEELLCFLTKYCLISLNKFAHLDTNSVTSFSNSDSFQHTSTFKLSVGIFRIKFIISKVAVWFDASNVSRVRFTKSSYQFIKLSREIYGNCLLSNFVCIIVFH